ncbi:hypothetical protein EM6_1190 [Asticcacaulis excentricus]|uniref:Uncharacterized protein n=1 Tax=Asticcacaulis excentricus TaxID=78587 RepID=A0A3G9G1U3_9CAUL|nr:hypothetical protein EM6_1190 [Asticcacaulis excentricus]
MKITGRFPCNRSFARVSGELTVRTLPQRRDGVTTQNMCKSLQTRDFERKFFACAQPSRRIYRILHTHTRFIAAHPLNN